MITSKKGAVVRLNMQMSAIPDNAIAKAPSLAALRWTASPSQLSILVDILVELTITVFVNSTNISTNIETAAFSTLRLNNLVPMECPRAGV